MLTLTLEKVQPLLARPVGAGQAPRVSGWLAALGVSLNSRYRVVFGGEPDTPDGYSVEPLFLAYVADALQRRLDKAKQMVDAEGAGPFSAKWNSASALGAWFLPAEIEEMDSVAGLGGTRTYRTPAPDYIRFNNTVDVCEPASDLEVIANEAAGSPNVSPA